MNECCPACGYPFQRAPGFYLGAMLFGYGIDFPILAATILLGHWILPSWPLPWLTLAACVAFLPAVPAVFRLTRVLFLHLDRHLDPDGPAD